MKTRLVLTIEVEESTEETIQTWVKLHENKEIKVKELFDPESKLHLKELGSLNTKEDKIDYRTVPDFFPDVEDTLIVLSADTRGVKVDKD